MGGFKTSLRAVLGSALLQLAFAADGSSIEKVQNDTTFSLLYGYPLLAYEKFAGGVLKSANANEFIHARQLATAANTSVVKPNVDTLYSSLAFDLSEDDLIVNIPDIPASQFRLFSYYDPFGDNFANTGTGNVASPGNYLLTPAIGSAGIGPTNETATNDRRDLKYEAVIHTPGPFGTLLVRWLVQNESSYEKVHAYQDAVKLTPLPRRIQRSASPALKNLLSANVSGSPAETALGLLAKFAPFSPPEESIERPFVSGLFLNAGIANGTYTPPSQVNLTAANETALKEAAEAAAHAVTILNNGWSMTTPNVTGDFHTNYGLRASVAAHGYLMLKAPNALYPSWTNSTGSSGSLGNTQLTLGANEALVYTFSARPPLKEAGFWSLTAYSNDYLISNKQNVYALGDRSNLTFSDGKHVYGGEAGSNGPFQILIQPADVAPPSNWTGNWLPAPAGGGNIQPLLRWYGADAALSNGSYQYPTVVRRAVITAKGNSGHGNGTDSPESQKSSASLSMASKAFASAFLAFSLAVLGPLVY